ncbi:MAG: AAA family ATPase [Pyrodictiaceae archaeon]
MLVRRVRLENFRGVVRGEVEFSPLTILLGPNNAGKTTILEALLLIHGINREVIGGLRVADILSESHATLKAGGLFHLLHKYSGTSKLLYHVSTLGDVELTIERRNRSLVFTYAWEKGYCNITCVGTSCSSVVIRGAPSELPKAVLIRPGLRRRIYEEIYKLWVDFVAKGITRRVAAWVSSVAGEEYSDILAEPFLGGVYTLYAYRARDGFRVRLGDLGDGVELLTAARMAVEFAQPELLLWDDVEAHMNPRALQLLALWLSDLVDQGVQVVLTTHSLEAATLIAETAEKARLVRLTMANGELEADYYSVEDIDKLKSLGVDVRA